MLPAFTTKHSRLLSLPFASTHFQLQQSDDNGTTTGTTLWLGAQCISAFLAHSGVIKSGMRVVELGGGIGYTALCLAYLGCHIVTSDLPSVISACLADNIERNRSRLPPGAGDILVRELDWTVPPELWSWDHESIISSPACPPPAEQQKTPQFDLIVSSDTIYSSELIQPFLRTLYGLCTGAGGRAPLIFICLERRDPALVDQALQDAKDWGFVVTRVPHHKVSKALVKCGIQWDKEDWEGVELWKLILK